MSAFPLGTLLGHPATLRTRAHSRRRHWAPGPREDLGGRVGPWEPCHAWQDRTRAHPLPSLASLCSQRRGRRGQLPGLGAGRTQGSFAL